MLLLSVGVGAQEPKPPVPPQERSTIRGANGISWREGDVTVTFLTGGVTVVRPDLTLQAGRAMVWKKNRKPGEPEDENAQSAFDELYAEGNVIFTRGGQKLRAERFYYSQAQNRGMIIDLRMEGFVKDLQSSFYVMASQARMAAGKVVAEDVKITSCPYGVPHYHLEVKKATLTGEDPRVAKGGFDPWPFESFHAKADEIFPELAGAPFFFIPALFVGPWVKNFPVRSIRYGHSSRFGHFLLTELGHRINKDDADGKPRQWGDLIGEIDWRQERGGAYGLDLEYKWNGYEGYVDSYYLDDLGRDPDLSFNAKFPPLVHEDRGKVHLFHRHDLSEHWRYELEAYYLSDRSLLEEFFEREFKEAKDPESAAYLRWLDGPMGAYVYERHRLNDFQTQNEYLPRAHYEMLSVPILGGALDNVYLTQKLDAVHIRRRFDKELHLESADTWRFDSVSELSMPWDLRYFQISPFAQGRMTFFEDDLEGESELRALWSGGARFVTQIHGTHPDVSWSAVGLRGLRHVAEIEVRYANTVDTNAEVSDFFPFEEVDQLGEFEEVSFELRQRFLTKDGNDKVFEFLSMSVGIEYYPDPDRDTVAANVNNYQPPFDWIPVLPGGPGGTFIERRWSNIHYEISLRPRSFLSMGLAGEYNSESVHEEVRELSVGLAPFQGFTASVSQTFVRGVTDAWTGGVTWALTPKWAASVYGQYDFRIDEYLKQRVVLARDYHDFVVEAVIERDFSRDENRFLVSLIPKFLGKLAARRSYLYRADGASTSEATDTR